MNVTGYPAGRHGRFPGDVRPAGWASLYLAHSSARRIPRNRARPSLRTGVRPVGNELGSPLSTGRRALPGPWPPAQRLSPCRAPQQLTPDRHDVNRPWSEAFRIARPAQVGRQVDPGPRCPRAVRLSPLSAVRGGMTFLVPPSDPGAGRDWPGSLSQWSRPAASCPGGGTAWRRGWPGRITRRAFTGWPRRAARTVAISPRTGIPRPFRFRPGGRLSRLGEPPAGPVRLAPIS